MNFVFVLLTMIFCHIIESYCLQGWLASLKQKGWWEINEPNKMYKKDYIMALVEHSFSWTFVIMLPIAIYMKFNLSWFYVAYPLNLLFYAFIDDLKVNKKVLNLVQDQIFHFGQIIVTYNIFVVINL